MVLLAFGYQIHSLDLNRRELEAQIIPLQKEYNVLLEDNNKLKQEIEYFSDPHNLEKELRARNYRKPGENLIIVTPQ
jgi:cell division protein FtsB